MPKLQISKTIVINAPIDSVYNAVSDLNHWTAWSPWLIMDPNAKVTVDDDNKSYSWDGKRVGSGNMKVIGEEVNRFVQYDLHFLKPWKSQADIRFELSEKEKGTEATWIMDSSLPWFMFWMKKMMVAFVSMDYQRGLNLLKDYVEDGEVHSKLEFKGVNSYSGCHYIGLKKETSISSLSESMRTDFAEMMTYVHDKKDLIAADAFTIYHKWDMANGKVSYTSGVPVNQFPDDLPSGMITGEIPELTVYTIRHTGPYKHLGNAWSTLYNMERSKEFKQNKAHHPFEIYLNSPMEVSENELISEINFAVKE